MPRRFRQTKDSIPHTPAPVPERSPEGVFRREMFCCRGSGDRMASEVRQFRSTISPSYDPDPGVPGKQPSPTPGLSDGGCEVRSHHLLGQRAQCWNGGAQKKTPTTEVVPKDPSTVGRKGSEGISFVTPPHTCKTRRHPPLVYHPVCQTVLDPV